MSDTKKRGMRESEWKGGKRWWCQRTTLSPLPSFILFDFLYSRRACLSYYSLSPLLFSVSLIILCLLLYFFLLKLVMGASQEVTDDENKFERERGRQSSEQT